MRSLKLATAALAPLALVASACSAAGSGTDDDLDIVAGFYPLGYVAERVAGEHADVTVLTPAGGDAHDLELTVQETARIAGATLVIHLDEFQPAVDQTIANNATGEALDAADYVDLLLIGESEEEHAAHGDDDHGHEEDDDHGHDEDDDHGHEDDDDHGHEDDDDHGHEDDDDHGHDEDDDHGHEGDDDHGHEDDHDHGDHDPHFWLDPLRMADLGDAIAERLGEIDEDNAASYLDNAAELREDLTALDASYVAGLADCDLDTVVVAHNAFSYLEKYGLHFESVAGLSPDAEPTPAHLGRLQRLITEEGITTVFSERLASPAFTQALADDLGIETAILDPIEGLTDETADEDYLSLMNTNLDALRTANGCR